MSISTPLGTLLPASSWKYNTSNDVSLEDQVFSNPLLLKIILRNLSKEQVLQTSLVSKTWDFVSREVLRNDKVVQLQIRACHNFIPFVEMLKNGIHLPFNGVSITFGQTCNCPSLYKVAGLQTLEETLRILLSKVVIKFLNVRLLPFHSYCMSFIFMLQVLHSKASSLESLIFQEVVNYHYPWSEIPLEDIHLPKLTKLGFPSFFQENDFLQRFRFPCFQEDLQLKLIRASPNLKQVYGTVADKSLEILIPLKLPVILNEFSFYPLQQPLDLVLKFALSEPQLKRLRFSTMEEANVRTDDGAVSLKMQSAANILNILLQSCENSLKEFHISNLDLLLIILKWKVPAMKNARKLQLPIRTAHGNFGATDVNEYLGGLDWLKYFPKLKEVTINDNIFTRGRFRLEFYAPQEFLNSSVRYSVDTVQTLGLTYASFLRETCLENLMRLFPNIKTLILDFESVNTFFGLFQKTLTAWPNVEKLIINLRADKPIHNVDNLFLGISKEEAEFLRKNVKEPSSLEIVPTGPTLCSLTKLKKLEIHFRHWSWPCSDPPAIDQFIVISQLTISCAFSRMPGLSVNIHRNLCRQQNNCTLILDHLEPFLTLLSSDVEFF